MTRQIWSFQIVSVTSGQDAIRRAEFLGNRFARKHSNTLRNAQITTTPEFVVYEDTPMNIATTSVTADIVYPIDVSDEDLLEEEKGSTPSPSEEDGVASPQGF